MSRVIRHYWASSSTIACRSLALARKPSSHGMAFTTEAAPSKPTIVYTITDEAPYLATFALLPLLKKFIAPAGIDIVIKDISVASRILANFSEHLQANQRVEDGLKDLGELVNASPHANVIKLPNVSASVPQLMQAIAELQEKGFKVPSYSPSDSDLVAKYSKVLGSAVNPVLREGNSDRRLALPVKEHVQKNPHKLKPWSTSSKTHVAHMTQGDFYASEKSMTMQSPGKGRIEFVSPNGETKVLNDKISWEKGDIIDTSLMSVKQLESYFRQQFEQAKKDDIMVSLHLKATMMKVSDPVIFGHAVKTYFQPVFEKHAQVLQSLGVNPNYGLRDLLGKIESLPKDHAEAIRADIQACLDHGPRLAMVDSDKGITNLHNPNDIIIDASIPPVIRDGGKMWNKSNQLEDTKLLIPDRCYAGIYSVMVESCKVDGQFEVAKMGHVSNVGLMAKKAEEYGSHDKTFEMKSDGQIRIVNAAENTTLFEYNVEAGDIFRGCLTKDVAIDDWIQLAANRARLSKTPAIFWLSDKRAHDKELISRVRKSLDKIPDVAKLNITIMSPEEAMKQSIGLVRQGKNVISVTGNVLRDYLTDLFPILEVGTSARMLSIVSLLKKGFMAETGAGGTAPKHVQQFVKENHLRWDSLGEYLAVIESLNHIGNTYNNNQALLLGKTLTAAVSKLLQSNKSPSRKVKELDNRGSTFYLGLYWAEELKSHGDSYRKLYELMKENESKIVADLVDCQGVPVDLGGYWLMDPSKVTNAMLCSPVLKDVLKA